MSLRERGPLEPLGERRAAAQGRGAARAATRAGRSFSGQALKYPESNGSQLLRERIALLYPGATAENVLVTTGTSEANFTTLWGLLEKGDRAAVMLPTYMQTWGLARAYAGRADAYRLARAAQGSARRWALDVASLERAVTKRTKVIMVTNPNNPTGAVLTEEEMDAIIRSRARPDAWIAGRRGLPRGRGRGRPDVADVLGPVPEGHRDGGPLQGLRSSGSSHRLDRRPPRRQRRAFWGYQDYTTLTPTMLSDRLARAAMEPRRREEILARTAAIIRRHLPKVGELDPGPRRDLRLHRRRSPGPSCW